MTDTKYNSKWNDLRNELLIGFHTQFAENQRANQQLFIKILGFLGAVIFGYVYVYEKYPSDIDKLSYALLVSEILLTVGAISVSIISYNFRRDQYVNYNIRKYCEVIGKDNIFPESYNPCSNINKKNMYTWMPNLLGLFYFVFPVFQIILCISFCGIVNILFNASNYNCFLTIIVVLVYSSILITLLSPRYFWCKYKKMCNKINTNTNTVVNNNTPTPCK